MRQPLGPLGAWLALLLFGAAIAGLSALARAGARRLRDEARRRSENPEAPWRWREDWAAGRIPSSSGLGAAGAWIVALFWCLVSAPLVLILPAEIQKGHRLAALGLVFPLVGILLVVGAVMRTLRAREFGTSVLALQTVPAPPGGRLVGVIETMLPGPPAHGFHLMLTCVRRRVTGSGQSRSTSETILWRGERMMTRALPSDAPGRAAIPVSFEVPADASPTSLDDPENRVLWIVGASAGLPGLDYRAEFEVPVFATAGAASGDSPRPSGPDPMAAYEAPEEPYRPGEDAHVVVRPSTTGGTEFYCGPFRNPGAALGMTCFLLIWAGAIALQLRLRVPLLFPVVFGLFGLLLLYLTLDLWLGTSRVVVEAGLLRVTRGFLGIGPTRAIPVESIASVGTAIRMQTGQRSGTPYYSVILARNDGRSTTLFEYLRDRREADWLASELRALAPAARSAVPGTRAAFPDAWSRS